MYKKVFVSLVGAGALTLAGLTFSVATAAEGPNGGSGSAPSAVAGTSAGMPRTAQVLFAVVNADGSLARGFVQPAGPTTKLGVGHYEVRFTPNVAGCSYQATIGQAATGVAPAGFITTAARAGVPTGVFIETRDIAGNLADRQFHLAVTC